MTDNERTYEPENQKQLFDLGAYAQKIREETSKLEKQFKEKNNSKKQLS